MSKFAGLVGYVTQEQTVPGVWSPVERPKKMKGDLLRLTASTRDDDKVNSDLSLNHRVSLVGDAYAFSNYYNIRWIQIDNVKWEVDSIEVQRPRIITTLGGVWNG